MKKKIIAFADGWSEEVLEKYIGGVIKGFEDTQADVYLFFCYGNRQENALHLKGEMNIFNLPNLKEFDGALIAGNGMDIDDEFEGLNRACIEAGLPTVTMGRKGENSVYFGIDNTTGMAELTERLITEQNARDFFIMAGSKESSDSNERLASVLDVLKRHEISVPEDNVVYTGWSPMAAADIAEKMHRENQKLPDVFICANDLLAMSLSARLIELGYNVPRDVKVTGFDNLHFGRIFSPSMCTVDPDFFEIGKQSALVLRRLMDGGTMPSEIKVPSVFIPSESGGWPISEADDLTRRNVGKDSLIDHLDDSLFDIKLSSIESALMNCLSIDDIRNSLSELYKNDRRYEGDSFHLLLDGGYRANCEEPDAELITEGYSDQLDVVFSIDCGRINEIDTFDSHKLVPGAGEGFANRFYSFSPLHEEDRVLGYVVFCDDYSKVKNASRMRTYIRRLNLTLIKAKQNLVLTRLVRTLRKMNTQDPLTHVKNRSAFVDKENEFDEFIKHKNCQPFSVGVFDVNNLKLVNDLLGHASGDDYLKGCCSLICDSFKRSPVFRTGGDEFLTILTGSELAAKDELIRIMQEHMEQLQKDDVPEDKRYSIAMGFADYNPDSDEKFNDVFLRADSLMYQNKVIMKKGAAVR